MRFLIGVAAGLVTGFVTSVLVTPRSGKQNRNEINRRLRKPVKDGKIFLNKAAWRTGLISEQKKAALNKKTVEAYNAKREEQEDIYSNEPERALEQAHEQSAELKT